MNIHDHRQTHNLSDDGRFFVCGTDRKALRLAIRQTMPWLYAFDNDVDIETAENICRDKITYIRWICLQEA